LSWLHFNLIDHGLFIVWSTQFLTVTCVSMDFPWG